MILSLRLLFSLVLVSMLVVTAWAGSQVPLWAIPSSVGGHPWFIATLFDTYWSFLIFFLWLCHKEPSPSARMLWLPAILLLGNLAMATYMLVLLYRLPRTADARALLLRSTPVPIRVPALLLACSGVLLCLAALR